MDDNEGQGLGRPAGDFEAWHTGISELRSLYHKLQTIARDSEALFGKSEERDRLLRLASTGSVFERETFRIMILGEFSSGKSTLINAMLGKNLLPTKANPATAFTTLLRWGEDEHAELYRSVDPRGGGTPVSIEQFQQEVSLQIDADGAPREPSFALAIVSQPLELLRRAVEIVDSAGINESPARERVTLGFLEQVDAVIFVTDAGRPFTLYETQNYLDHVLKLGHRDIFFVVNQFDRIDEGERAEVQSRCRNAVSQIGDRHGTFFSNNIFFVSARDALRARLQKDEEGVQKSAINELERALDAFCIRDAARVKFVRLAEFLRYNTVNLRRHFQDEGGILTKSVAELRDLLDRSQANQEQLQQNVTKIREMVERWVDETERQIRDRFTVFLRDLSAEIPGWEVGGSGRFDRARKMATKAGREALRRNFLDSYTSVLQRKMQRFCTKEIDTLIANRQTELLERISPLIKEHEEAFENLRGHLTGSHAQSAPDYLLRTLALSVANEGAERAHSDIPLRFRPSSIMAAGAGAGSAIAGGLTLASVAGMIALPPLVVVLGIGAALGPILSATGALVWSDEKLRSRASEQFAEQLRNSAGNSADQYARIRATDLRVAWNRIADTLTDRIRDLISSVKRSVEDHRLDEQGKQDMRNKIFAHEQELTLIEDRIGEFLRPHVSDTARK